MSAARRIPKPSAKNQELWDIIFNPETDGNYGDFDFAMKWFVKNSKPCYELLPILLSLRRHTKYAEMAIREAPADAAMKIRDSGNLKGPKTKSSRVSEQNRPRLFQSMPEN